MVLEKTLESPLDYKEIQPVHSNVPSKTTCSRRRDRHGKNPGLVWAMEGRRKEMVMDRIRQEAREMESCMADHS